MKFETRKYLFLLPLGWVAPGGFWGLDIWTCPNFGNRGSPEIPRLRKPQGADQGTERGGSGDAMHSCDEPKIDVEDLKEQDGSLPETNSKFAPEKMDGTGRRSGFLLGFGLFSGAFAVSFREGNPWKLNSSPLKIYLPSPKRRGKRLPVLSIFSRSFCCSTFGGYTKKSEVVISFFLFLKPSCGMLRKWSNLTCAYFSDGLKPQPPTREDYNERCFWDLQFQITTDLNGWCRYKLPRFLCKLGSKWFNLIPTLSKLLCWHSSRIPHKIWYFHSEILSSCNLLFGYLSNIAIFHFHDYGRKSIGNSCFVLCTPWLVHLFPLVYFALLGCEI